VVGDGEHGNKPCILILALCAGEGSAVLQNCPIFEGTKVRCPLDWRLYGPQSQYGHVLYQLSYFGSSSRFRVAVYIHLYFLRF
jgi:hypothetical protein